MIMNMSSLIISYYLKKILENFFKTTVCDRIFNSTIDMLFDLNNNRRSVILPFATLPSYRSILQLMTSIVHQVIIIYLVFVRMISVYSNDFL